MNRSTFIRFAASALLVVPPAVRVQRPDGQFHRVAILEQGTGVRPTKPGAFGRTLRELGYVLGQNFAYELRGAGGDNRRFPFLMSELLTFNPDVVVAETTPGALAAKRATATVPIVMVNVSDPVGSGLVASLAHPGGNLTGVTDHGLELVEKSVELIREVVPKAQRLGVLMSDNPVHATQLEEIRAAARHFALLVLPFKVLSIEEVEAALSAMLAQKVDAFIALGGAPLDSTKSQSDLVPALAAKVRLPDFYPAIGSVKAGGLMSYGTNGAANWALAARYVDRILKGARPADLPVQQPKVFELAINLTTASNLGLTIPPALLLQADKILR